jgi:CRISPR/Cas system CSM-associated protein Csm3 (group 7 of RAMP superfamily)
VVGVNTLAFTVRFHGPVRVGRGRAAPGVDDTVDPDVLVPGSSLKGLMRAEAVLLFGDPELVGDVFGAADRPSPWHWDDVRTDDDVRFGTRIRIDPESGTAADGGLFTAQFRWPDAGRFVVRRFAPLRERDVERHETVLWAAALSVHSIGADRNRGFGWVDVVREGALADDAFLDRVVELRGASA